MQANIVGTRIGIYDVLYECDYKTNDGHKLYRVKCSECGWETDMQKRHISDTKECTHIGIDGVYKEYTTIWKNKRIGSIFRGMKTRCYNMEDKSYKWYGAKGIKICDEWMRCPELFEEWSLNNGYKDNLTIDRIEEDKDYCPENCRWVTNENNAKYKTTTSYIEIDGEVHTGRDWSEKLGLGTNRINTYIREHGLENTKEFVRRYLKNPTLSRTNRNISYYDLYMKDDIGLRSS
jgi:hypothetical protein